MLSNCGAGEDKSMSMRVPWTARTSNQSILKEINPEYSLEGLMLKLQYFGHLMWRADLLEKTLMLGKIKGRKRRGRQRVRSLDGITDLMDMGLGELHELVMNGEARHAAIHGVAKNRTRLNDWTELNWKKKKEKRKLVLQIIIYNLRRISIIWYVFKIMQGWYKSHLFLVLSHKYPST